MATNQISTSPYLLSDSNQASYRYNGEMAPETALEEQALNRRQHIANLLIQQGLAGSGTNRGQMVGRFYVPGSPLQGLGEIAKVGLGAYGTYANDQSRADLAAKDQGILSDAVTRYIERTKDVPAVPPSAFGGTAAAPPQAQMAEAMAAPQGQAAPATMEQAPMGTPASPSVFSGIYPMGPDESGWEPKGPIQDLNAAAPAVPTPQQQVAQSLAQQQAPMQGPVSPGTPGRARTPQEMRDEIITLMASPHPRAAHIGQFIAQQEQQTQQHALDREVRREGIESNALMRAEMIRGNMQNLESRIAADERAGIRDENTKNQLARMNADLQKTLHGMDIEGRKDVAGIVAESRRDVQGMKGQRGAGMSATAQKELIQTEEEMQTSHQALNSIDSALALNDKAMGFKGAGAVASAGSILPDAMRPASIDATIELDNMIIGSALPQMKAMFGTNPTEGERAAMIDLQASSGKPASVRKEIMGRAKQAINNRLKFNAQKADQLRKGTYFSGEGGLDTSADATPLTTVPTTKGKPNAFQPFHDPEEEKAYQQWKLEHK